MKEMRRGKIIYGGMIRGRRNFLIINIILAVIYILYLCRSMPFVVGKLHGPYEFNEDKFFSSTQDITIDEQIEIKKRADKSIPYYAYIGLSYQDEKKYRFNVEFDEFKKVKDGSFMDYIDPKTGETIPKEFNAIYIGKIGDRNVPVLWSGLTAPQPNVEISGVFTEPADIVVAEISALVPESGNISINEYLFDARGVEMETENTDIAYVLIGFALVVFLFVRLIRYYINPYSHPAYRQLEKYGTCDTEEVIEDIENQFESDDVYTEGKELIATDWIMTKDFFKNKVVKNHRTSGRFS